MMPLPKKLVEQGVRDMVRISDARMSGTSYGTCILHVAPESAVGGPLAAVRTGDLIELDVAAGAINARVDEAEWSERLALIEPLPLGRERGYLGLYRRHVNQADRGCDFDFLAGVGNPEPEIL
jgi:dihydroxyacid dehydratase/phosphogluconate dehydratase